MANDLATGLGLGLKAAEMAQRSEEAEKERDFRGGMAAREQQQQWRLHESTQGLRKEDMQWRQQYARDQLSQSIKEFDLKFKNQKEQEFFLNMMRVRELSDRQANSLKEFGLKRDQFELIKQQYNDLRDLNIEKAKVDIEKSRVSAEHMNHLMRTPLGQISHAHTVIRGNYYDRAAALQARKQNVMTQARTGMINRQEYANVMGDLNREERDLNDDWNNYVIDWTASRQMNAKQLFPVTRITQNSDGTTSTTIEGTNTQAVIEASKNLTPPPSGQGGGAPGAVQGLGN